ncbi:MAG: hypothetical protein Q7P63_17160 [Verrucomicrobiota bacterium JB022]|nr:hypothetical protein [Verrucomicrobiota bacterium JB022]
MKQPLKTFLKACSLAAVLAAGTLHSQTVLLDDSFADGNRFEANFPDEAAVWTGSPEGLVVNTGSLDFTFGGSTTRIWTYFTGTPYTLNVGEKLTVSVTLVPTGLSSGASRGFRMGLFHHEEGRVEEDINTDSGGAVSPWADSEGYAAFLRFTSNPTGSVTELGKRMPPNNSLLGSTSAFTRLSDSGTYSFQDGVEYTLSYELYLESQSNLVQTMNIYEGSTLVSSYAVNDNGTDLGEGAPFKTFDMLFLRVSDAASTASQVSIKNISAQVESGSTGGGESWGGYPYTQENWVHAANWFGSLYLAEFPWVYSPRMGRWIYFTHEPAPASSGEWVWVPKD